MFRLIRKREGNGGKGETRPQLTEGEGRGGQESERRKLVSLQLGPGYSASKSDLKRRALHDGQASGRATTARA